MKNTSSSKFGRRVSLLVAMLVMVVLVGSLVVVLNFTHGPGTGVTGASATATPTTQPTVQSTATANPNRPAHEGQIVYSSPQSNGDYRAFAWSPDSQRVAASTNGQVQIWDATT
ncbi:MAG: hypothetical protein ABI413_00075, partial [Ktedonobacteraceae bacterium]